MSRGYRSLLAVFLLVLFALNACSARGSTPPDTNNPPPGTAKPNATLLVSAVDSSMAAGNNESWHATISADGRYVAFQSAANNLVPGVTRTQVYRRDIQTNSTILVSAIDGSTAAGNSDSWHPSISADGRYIAFLSDASNLVPGVSGTQVYLRDTQTNSTTLVSAVDGGTTTGPGDDFLANVGAHGRYISADGRYITFSSHGRELIEGVPSTNQQVYLRDTQTNRTILVSAVDNGTTPGNSSLGEYGPGGSDPSISADGRYVAFWSSATNFLEDISEPQLYMRDIEMNRTILVSAAHGSTTPGDNASASSWGSSDNPSISPDGRYVAFWSSAPNLVEGVSGPQVYLRDTQTNSTTLVSAAHGSTTEAGGGDYGNAFYGNIAKPSVSTDGRFVAFISSTNNLVPGVGGLQVYLRDIQANDTILMSATTGGTAAGNRASDSAYISADGRAVVFNSWATNLVPGVGGKQVYLRIR
jgi:Tol biopolymer transport system component